MQVGTQQEGTVEWVEMKHPVDLKHIRKFFTKWCLYDIFLFCFQIRFKNDPANNVVAKRNEIWKSLRSKNENKSYDF